MEDEEQLDQEIQNTVRKIIRDFVSSWYSTISTERAFEINVQEAMISMAMELKSRARLVDQKVLGLYCHTSVAESFDDDDLMKTYIKYIKT